VRERRRKNLAETQPAESGLLVTVYGETLCRAVLGEHGRRFTV